MITLVLSRFLPGRRGLVSLLLGILLSFFSLPSLPAATIWVVTRAELGPWALEALQHRLEQQLGAGMSVTFRKVNGERSLDEIPSGTWILGEPESPEITGLTGFASTPLRQDLWWMLGVWRSQVERHAGVTLPLADLQTFIEVCRSSRGRVSDAFPWFQGLYDPGTLHRLEDVLGRGTPSTTASNVLQKGGLLAILNLAVEENLLNPLSLEADSSLAFEVFEAGDCAFSGMWVLPSMVREDSALRRRLPDLHFQAFPGPAGEAPVACISLRLFVPEAVIASWPTTLTAEALPSTRTVNLSPVMSQVEQDWEKKQFPKLYNRLIRGDF